MAIRRSLKGTQARARVLAVRVDGSVVTTTAASTGLLEGGYDMTVVKGTGGASNEVTIAFDIAFLRVPVIVCTAITTNCHVEIKSVSKTGAVLETFQVADGTTGVDDADFHMMIMGWDTASVYNFK